jgi:hypothetical protein
MVAGELQKSSNRKLNCLRERAGANGKARSPHRFLELEVAPSDKALDVFVLFPEITPGVRG